MRYQCFFQKWKVDWQLVISSQLIIHSHAIHAFTSNKVAFNARFISSSQARAAFIFVLFVTGT